MKIVNGLKAKKAEIIGAANALALAVMTNPVVSAGDGGAKNTMVNLIKTILPYLAVIGLPIALMGAFKLIMAFRNDQGDAVPAAARDLAIGIVITLFGTIGGAVLSSL